MSGLADGIDSALSASPGLVNTPGLALDAGSSLDPTTFAPVLSHAANVKATADALDQSNQQDKANNASSDSGSGGGILGAIGHFVQSIPGVKEIEHAGSTVLHYLGAPLREIQRDYRFLHMAWTKGGVVSGLTNTIAVLGATALGSLVGPEGAFLAGETTAAAARGLAETGIEGQNLRDIADQSADPKVKISLGRDIAHALGWLPGLGALNQTDKGVGKYVSGGADATFDWFADPVVLAAKAKTGLKLGEYGTVARNASLARVQNGLEKDGRRITVMRSMLNGDLLRTMQTNSAAQWFDKVAPGIQFRSPEQLDNLYNSSLAGASYRRALTHIVNINKASDAAEAAGHARTAGGDIVARYPELDALVPNVLKSADGTVTMKGLGAARTEEEAHQVFRNAYANQEFADRLGSLSVVPSRTLTRVLPSKLAEFAQKVDSQTPVDQQRSLTGATVRAAGNLATLNPQAAKDVMAGAIARKVRTFSGYMPFALDKNTLNLTAQSFGVDLASGQLSPTAAKGIMNTFRFSMGEQRARYWTDQFLNASDLGEQKRIWAEANVELLKAAGLPEGNELVQNVRRQLANITAGPMSEPKQFYGWGKTMGASVSEMPAGDVDTMGALWGHQAALHFSFPNFNEIKQAQRELSGFIKANYGKFDDMVARRYVQSIFKPLALLNAGFGFRVAMAEAIPQAMRVGLMTTMRDMVNTKAAKLEYKLTTGEDNHIIAAAAHALSLDGAHYSLWNGINRLLNDPEARSRATELVMRHNGHIAQGVARTGESEGGIDTDPFDRARVAAHVTKGWYKNDPRIKFAGTKDFDLFRSGEDNFDGAWHTAVSNLAQDHGPKYIARDFLDGQMVDTVVENEAERWQRAIDGHPDAIPAYVNEAKVLRAADNIRAGNWTAKDFAARRVDALRGLTEGADGTVHTDLLENIARGELPDIQKMAAVPQASRPEQVYGNVSVPYIGPNVMQRIVKYGFAHVVDPIINGLSRDPMYFNHVSTELDNMAPMVERGLLDSDTAWRIAETRAVVNMLPKIHNTALRSQFSVLARNFFPFYFAQEQALKRAGKLVATHPQAFRQYQLVEHGLNDPGFVHKDDQGNKFFIFPGMGVFQDAAHGMMGLFGDAVQAGLPITVKGSMESLNTLLPEFQMPGVSPMVSVPLNKLAQLFPELSPSVKDIVGDRGFGQSAFDAIIPHPVAKAAWRVLNPDEKDAAYANAVFTAMAASYYHGDAPGANASDAEKADWINRIKNNARSTFLVKAMVGMLSPLAPQVTEEDQGLRDEFYKLVKKSGYKEALATFLKTHGDKAISYTVAHSKPTVEGAYMPYTKQALDFINSPEGKSLLHSKLATGAAFLVPQAQGQGDVQTIHAELVRNHLRQQFTPQEFLDAIDIAAGNNAISAPLAEHKAILANAASSQVTRDENARWTEYLKIQQMNNPTWYNYWTSTDRRNLARNAWAQLKQIYENGLAPDTEQSRIVMGLMDDYAHHALKYATAASAKARKEEKQTWQAYLDKRASDDPLAYSVIHAVFSRLDSAGILGSSTSV